MAGKFKDQNSKIKITIQNLKFLIFTLSFYTLIFTLYTSPVFAACDPKHPPIVPEDCPAGLEQIEQVFTNVISVIVGLGFIAMLVMLVMAGFKYLTSGGEPKAISSAHQAVTWALLGVVFMALAWLILQLIHTFTGINVTVFNINVLKP